MEPTLAHAAAAALRRPFGAYSAPRAAAIITPRGGGTALWYRDGSVMEAGQPFATVEAWALYGPGTPDTTDGPALYIEGNPAELSPLLRELDRIGLAYRVRNR